MTSATIKLHIGNALPPGNQAESARVISLWKTIDGFFKHKPFVAMAGTNALSGEYQVSLDASALLTLMEQAVSNAGSFDAYATKQGADSALPMDAALIIAVSRSGTSLTELESYQLVSIFIQQLVLACTICLPGSIQILDARFAGDGAHRYEAQTFDSKILYGAMKAASYNEWPALAVQSFERVWEWLATCETSCTDTAVKNINKVLFTLLKVAEQRHEYSARTVLLVIYQLEVLLDCRQVGNHDVLQARARSVLGAIPEQSNCLRELQEVRNNLFLASQPVHRPPLICNNTAEVLRGQIGQHNSAVESGSAMVLALLHDLIKHDAQCYTFSEIWKRV
ncbi:hypothetical protein E3V39_08255 [Gammaproteobacteria bacterium LSUCC0112]|nr:hypothetical protein E3V39_08255 [Gammaproteobacteria bacterium LSUCC0112]